jgi:hypothetical protein
VLSGDVTARLDVVLVEPDEFFGLPLVGPDTALTKVARARRGKLSFIRRRGVSMKTRSFNWPVWAGFLLSLVAFLSYFFVFVRFPVTRDFPWASLLLFAAAAALLVVGVRRAFAPERRLGAKVAGLVAATLGVAVFGFFVFSTFIMARWMPAAQDAPQVGSRAPEFSLPDTDGRPVSLSELLSAPISGKAPKGVLLVFYRGHW